MSNNSSNDVSDNNEALPQLMLQSANAPDWVDGSAEPWVANVLAALLSANGTKTAIEIGGFRGHTSVRLSRALAKLPWPTNLTVCEIDQQRAFDIEDVLDERRMRREKRSTATVVVSDSLAWIPTLKPESVDFVWLDGCHEAEHVGRELSLLATKIAPGGIIAGHDVFGSCNLHIVFRAFAAFVGWPSMSLDFPKLGPAGGVGLIQRPR